MFRLTPCSSSKLLTSLKSLNSRVSVLKPLQAASICRKEDINPVILESKPKPWPWEKVPLPNILNWIGVDRSINRFDENTVVISIEGNIGVGKTTFAKALSNILGTRYYPEPDLDSCYIRDDGFDFRTLNYKLPENCHYVDDKLFYLNPDHPAVSGYQVTMFQLRVLQYLDVLAHVLSTGQGVVSDLSPYSQLAYQTAMHKMKWGTCGKSFIHFCRYNRDELTPELLRPHVVIYLDAPADVCLERVKKRGIPHEVNSRAMCKEYLEHIEFTYKDHILPELEAHSEVLVYDWTDPPDIDFVIDDLESLNVHERPAGEKMEDWRYNSELFYNLLRQYYTSDRITIYRKLNPEKFWAPDLMIAMDEIDHRGAVLEHIAPWGQGQFTVKSPKDFLRVLLAPNWHLSDTYLDRRIRERFAEPRPRRGPPKFV